MSGERGTLGIIGRERKLIDDLTGVLHREVEKRGHWTTGRIEDLRRGNRFEAAIELDGELTGHVAIVTVELDRLDEELVGRKRSEHS